MAAGYDGSIRIDTRVDTKGFNSGVVGITKSLKTLGATLGIAFGVKTLISFGKAAIGVASDLEEVQNVVDVTFGEMSGSVDDFAKSALKNFGLSELSAKQYASTMGAMLKSSGLAGQAVTDMSIEMTKLAADMASFYNLSTDEAFAKIRSGISGETEPLKQLGINLNVANLEAFALSQGITKSYNSMSQAEQVMLRYNYLLSVTGDAQGDFARTSGSWANQVRLLKEQWQKFLGLLGDGLIKIALPVVKFLNKVLELLILILEKIGQLYTAMTGKQLVDASSDTSNLSDSTTDLADSANSAAEGQNGLAKGIKKAKKAAESALAPFDELNILQHNMSDGDTGTGTGVGGITFPKTNFGDIEETDGKIDGLKKKFEDFFFVVENGFRALRDALLIPIYVPAPIFGEIPNPIYTPNWGLDLPTVPTPIFPPIKDPVYAPNWGLVPPVVPAPVFLDIKNPVYEPNWNLIPPPVPVVEIPPINSEEYQLSLETLGLQTSEFFGTLLENVSVNLETLSINIGIAYALFQEQTTALLLQLETSFALTMEKMKTNVDTTLNTVSTNLGVFKENVATLATGISTVLVANINKGLSTMGANVNKAIETIQTNLQTFGQSVGNIASDIAKAWVNNLNEGFKTAKQNFVVFANAIGENLKEFGGGFLRAAAETAQGFVSNMVNGFAKVWENFVDLMSGIGEKVSGWFRENKEVVVKTAITAGIVLGAGALALTVPAAIPYVAGALGTLKAIPGLATGCITRGPMLAMVGDNPGGKEAVAPLGELQDMLTSAVSTALIQSNQFNMGNTQPIVIKVNLDNKEIARAIYDPLQDEKSRRGDDPVIQPI